MYRLLIAAVIAAVMVLIFLKWRDEQLQMSEVTPGLLISNWAAATDEHLLRRKGITLIICLNERHKTRLDWDVLERLEIRHHHVAIADRPDAPIALLFDRLCCIITAEIKQGGRVLIHCRAGISRSVTVAAAYMIQKNNISAREAITQIRRARRIAWPNHGFRRALVQWATRFI